LFRLAGWRYAAKGELELTRGELELTFGGSLEGQTNEADGITRRDTIHVRAGSTGSHASEDAMGQYFYVVSWMRHEDDNGVNEYTFGQAWLPRDYESRAVEFAIAQWRSLNPGASRAMVVVDEAGVSYAHVAHGAVDERYRKFAIGDTWMEDAHPMPALDPRFRV
jgi:hypothetical protein